MKWGQCHVERPTGVETSVYRYLHSLRSVDMTSECRSYDMTTEGRMIFQYLVHDNK